MNSELQLTVRRPPGFLKPEQKTDWLFSRSQLPATLGRQPGVAIQLIDDSVSRKHALISQKDDGFWIQDTGSKAGTMVNGMPIVQPHFLRSGDQIQVGPLTLLVRVPNPKTDRPLKLSNGSDSLIVASQLEGQLSTIQQKDLEGLQHHRLSLLLRSTEQFSQAGNVSELARLVTEAAVQGTGAGRAVLLGMEADGSWSVWGHDQMTNPDSGDKLLEISQSLVKSASEGRITVLDDAGRSSQTGQSIQDLGIRSAIAVPVEIESQVVAVLYLDARDREHALYRDFTSYCVGLAQLTGLALAKQHKEMLEAREKQLRTELNAARRAQQMLLPPAEARVGPIRYCTDAEPGTIVAGDLFDVIPLSSERTVVVIGDVMGKGAPAGLMMATIQTFLRSRVDWFAEMLATRAECQKKELDLAGLVKAANQFFCRCFPRQGFVTLWIGCFERGRREFQYVDAGHGHWLFSSENGIRQLEDTCGGLFVGGRLGTEYEVGRELLGEDERIILYTDGLVEQECDTRERFDLNQIADCLKGSLSSTEDVRRLKDSHRLFRGTRPLADDLLIASIQLREDHDG